MRMKFFVPSVMAGMLAFQAGAAQFPISGGDIRAVLDTTGGSLSALSFRGKNLTVRKGGENSFTELALAASGRRELIEKFAKLEFRPVETGPESATFSALGVKAFDWLRITKSYRIEPKKRELVVTWRLANLSPRPRPVGFWIKSFLRRDDGMGMANRYFYPRGGEFTEVLTRRDDGIFRELKFPPETIAKFYDGNLRRFLGETE